MQERSSVTETKTNTEFSRDDPESPDHNNVSYHGVPTYLKKVALLF
jgi:hypothetical protein